MPRKSSCVNARGIPPPPPPRVASAHYTAMSPDRGGIPFQSWMGAYPIQPWTGGYPHSVPGSPIQSWRRYSGDHVPCQQGRGTPPSARWEYHPSSISKMGYLPFWTGMGYPLVRKDMVSPIRKDGGSPQLGRIGISPVGKDGYPCHQEGWGNPLISQIGGTPHNGGQSENNTFRHPSDAGGNDMINWWTEIIQLNEETYSVLDGSKKALYATFKVSTPAEPGSAIVNTVFCSGLYLTQREMVAPLSHDASCLRQLDCSSTSAYWFCE